MNCFLNEVRGYVDLDEGGRNTDFALWQVRIQNLSCEDMDGECQQMGGCIHICTFSGTINCLRIMTTSPHVDKCLDTPTPQSNTLL